MRQHSKMKRLKSIKDIKKNKSHLQFRVIVQLLETIKGKGEHKSL